MAAVSKLPSAVETQLISTLSITSVCQCTEELVLNSLEANSGWIKIRLNLPACAVEVLDDGQGIPMENLAAVGTGTPGTKPVPQRYALSGRSLCNIAGVAERVTVVSRGRLSLAAYQKTVHRGVDLGISPVMRGRLPASTLVAVEGIFYNLPVRQKSLDSQKETAALISFLEHMSLIYPEVFFTLEDAATRKPVLQLPKCRSTAAALSRLAGVPLTRSTLAPIEIDHACFSIKGYVAKQQVTPSRNRQYIFINRRPVMYGRLHESVNKSVAQRCNQLGGQNMQGYAILFLNVSCDRSEYSLYLDALHSEAEFKKQQDISTAFDKVGKCIAQHLCWSTSTVRLPETAFHATSQPAASERPLSITKSDTLSVKMVKNSNTVKRSDKPDCALLPDTPPLPGACKRNTLYSSSATESTRSRQLHSGYCAPQSGKPTAPCVSVVSATATNTGRAARGGMLRAATGPVAPSASLHQTWARWNNPVFTTQQERLAIARLPSKDQRTSRHHDERVNAWKFSKDMIQHIEELLHTRTHCYCIQSMQAFPITSYVGVLALTTLASFQSMLSWLFALWTAMPLLGSLFCTAAVGKVIGQVDNKFIAGNLTWRNTGGDIVKMLVLVDQHAADERIRFERYLQGVVPSPSDCSKTSPPPSKPLSNPISISVSNKCRKPTLHFVQSMSTRGFTLQAKSNCGVIVQRLPLPLVETVNDRVTPVITIDQLKDVLVEYMECTEAGQPPQMVPPSLLTILKSLACHGAIRFGDPLTRSQSEELIADLLLCDLPFQCAHGRPSIAPLIRLSAGR